MKTYAIRSALLSLAVNAAFLAAVWINMDWKAKTEPEIYWVNMDKYYCDFPIYDRQ